MQKKNLIKGTLILAAAGIIAKIFGFFFRIPIIYMIGEEGIGLYQLTYPLYTFLLAIAAGIPTALSKMISERVALHKRGEANKIFRIALITMALFGGISSLILIVFADYIIEVCSWSREVYYSLIGISLAPLFTCLLSVFRGYFQGLQNMLPTAVSQVLEQLVRVIVGVSLVYILLPRGISISAGGAAFGATAGAFIALVWIVFCYMKNKIKHNREEKCKSSIDIFTEILKIAIPISIGQAIGSIMTLIDSMMVTGLLKSSGFTDKTATILYGQLTGKAFVLINVPLTLSIAIAQNTVPAISEAFAARDRFKLRHNIKISYKLAMILALPCCAGLYTLSRPILGLVFQGMSDGWELMQILSVAALFIILAQTSTSILNGMGKTIMPVIAMIIGSGIKILISIIFIPMPQYNIKAAAYGTLFAYLAVAIIDIVLVIKYTKVYIDIHEVFILPVVATIVMIISVVASYGKIYNLTRSGNLTTVLTIFIGAFSYFLMLFLSGAVKISDLKNKIKK